MTTHHHDQHTGGGSGGGSCGGHAPSRDDLAHVGAEDVAECPVMVGTTVIKAQAEESGLYRDYRGTRYWLCCDSCGPLFDADPDRYTAASSPASTNPHRRTPTRGTDSLHDRYAIGA